MNNTADIKLTFKIPYGINKNKTFISKETLAKAIENAEWFQMPISIDCDRNDIYKMSEVIGHIQGAPQEIVWDDNNHIVEISIGGKLFHSAINTCTNLYGIDNELEIIGITLNK